MAHPPATASIPVDPDVWSQRKLLPWSPRLDFPLLLAVSALFHAFSLPSDRIPAHDALYGYQVFQFFYSGLLSAKEFPLWVPYGFLGIPADYFANTFLSASQIGVGAVGLLANAKDTLLLYKISVVWQSMVFLAGVWLLSAELYANRLTRLFVALSLSLSTFWLAQIFFNLLFVWTVPLVLALLFRFARTGQGAHFHLAVAVSAIGMWGNTAYFGVIYAYLYGFVCLALGWGRPRLLLAIVKPSWKNGLGALLAAIAFIVYVYSILKQFDQIHYYPVGGRDPETLRSSLDDFLSYNTIPSLLRIASEFLMGKSFVSDLIVYAGLLPCLFFGVFLFRRPDRRAWALLIPFLAFGAIALGGIAAKLAWHLPLFPYYRHLGYLWGVEKLLVVLLAGFGLDLLAPRLARLGSVPWTWAAMRRAARLLALPVPFLLVAVLFFVARSDLMDHAYLQFTADKSLVRNILFLRLAVFALFAAAAILALRWRAGLFPRAFAVLLLAFVLFDLALFRAARLHLYPRLSNTEAFRALSDPGPWEFRVARSENPQSVKDQVARMFFEVSGGVRYAFHHNFGRFETAIPTGRMDFISKPVAELLAARGKEGLQDKGALLADLPLRQALAIETSKFSVAGAVYPVEDAEKSRALMRGPHPWGEIPVLVSTNRHALFSDPGGQNGVQLDRVDGYSPNHLRLSLRVASAATLLYSDAWHPDWKAFVDGTPREVMRANHAFKAVTLLPGDRALEFRFVHFRWNRLGHLILGFAGFFSSLGLLCILCLKPIRGLATLD